MRKLAFFTILLLTGLAHAGDLTTVQPTALLIASADSNVAALDVNQTSWTATAEWPEISSYMNVMKIKWYVYDPCGPNDTTFSYEFHVADYGCNTELVAYGTATTGAAQLSHNPTTLAELNSGDPNTLYCWADTLGTPTDDWAPTIKTQNDGGLDGVASLLFDRESGKRAWCRIYGMSSTTMTVYCVAYGY